MVQRKGGFRRKTRHKLSRSVSERGKIYISKYMQTLKAGDHVVLKADPSCQKGMYHMRFHGKVGIVKSQRGNGYEVEIHDFKKPKILFVQAVHLKRLE